MDNSEVSLLSVPQFAVALGVTSACIRRWILERKITPTLAQWLRVYSVSNSSDTENFFARKNGKAIKPRLLLRTFESVRRRMGVSRVDGMGRQPRLRDLRRTFAVHCLKAWTDQKKDLRKMLPILAAYLGHVNLFSTEEYLLLAPNRFRKQLSTLSPAFL